MPAADRHEGGVGPRERRDHDGGGDQGGNQQCAGIAKADVAPLVGQGNEGGEGCQHDDHRHAVARAEQREHGGGRQ